jgi:hypothetical protein
MKRGRPSKRTIIQTNIIQILEQKQIPLTISALAKIMSSTTGRAPSWNTVEKYIQELIVMDKVQAIPLPHSKEENKEGLTVYSLKK